MKTLNNSDVKGAREQVKDIEVFGDGDMFKLLCKASSKNEGWMKSTKALEVKGMGCLVQVTTQQETWDEDKGAVVGNTVAEALCWVPGVTIEEQWEGSRDESAGKIIEKCVGRRLVQLRHIVEEAEGAD